MYIFLILVFSVALIGAFVYKNAYYDVKKSTEDSINKYLEANNYQEKVLEKEIVFDSKTGKYFARVTFEDEPDNVYEIFETSSDHFKVYGYKNGVEIINKSEGKYITEH